MIHMIRELNDGTPFHPNEINQESVWFSVYKNGKNESDDILFLIKGVKVKQI